MKDEELEAMKVLSQKDCQRTQNTRRFGSSHPGYDQDVS